MRTVFIIVLVALFGGHGDCEVFQNASIETREFSNVQIHCYQNVSSNKQMFWYRQLPNKPPQLFTTGYKDPVKHKHFTMNISQQTQTTTLSTDRIELSDASVYVCAVEDSGGGSGKLLFGKGTRLTVEPEEKSETAAFVLGSDEDNKEDKARACLITDFSSHNISVNFGGVDVPVVPSVIKGDKQYSVVAFLPESKDRSNFNCNAFVNGNTTEGDNNDIENVCESDSAYVFESDEKLNSLSLMVLGLRVIFLKSIVFNVLMTVRAWMS